MANAVDDGIGGRVVEVVDDPTVGEEHGAVGVRGGDGVVGDHDDRLTELTHRGTHERQDLGARVGVEVAGRLVGEDDFGAAGERSCDRDPLLLPAGQFRRSMLQAVLQPDGLDDLVEPRGVGLAAGESGGECDVLRRGQCRDEVERLEDEPDPVAAQLREPAVVELVTSVSPMNTVPDVR